MACGCKNKKNSDKIKSSEKKIISTSVSVINDKKTPKLTREQLIEKIKNGKL